MNTPAKRITVLVLILIFAIVAQPPARSMCPQTNGQTGAVNGVIVDIHDARVVGAKVVISNKSFHRELISDDAGEFEIYLPTGKYTITVERLGFRRYKSKRITVRTKEILNVKIQLEVAHSS